MAALPHAVRQAIIDDGYNSAKVMQSCFLDGEGAGKWVKLDAYAKGLILVRNILGDTGLTPETLAFAPIMGKIRDVLEGAVEEVAENTRAKRCRQELEDVEAIAKSKVQAKEEAKEAAKGGKKVTRAEKLKLEEALLKRHPGTPGLSGRLHTATGPAFLEKLLKAAEEKDYVPPPWEDRCVYFSSNK